jgi:hypothetical protein
MRQGLGFVFITLALAGCSSGGHSSSFPAAAFAPVSSSSSATPTSVAPASSSSSSTSATPSDDPDDWVVDTTVNYDPVISAPTFIVPSPSLPPGVKPMASNNNCAICFHEGRLFFAFRTAEIHFASMNTHMYVLSSVDRGTTWELENDIAFGSDAREPSFISIGGRLFFRCFQAGTNPAAFEPRHMWRFERTGLAQWTQPVDEGIAEVPWDLKVRHGKAWMTSYKGNHYSAGVGDIEVYFKMSNDGFTWQPVDPTNPVVYKGGVSECGWEFDQQGGLWVDCRNEDGDASGFGSMLATAPASSPGRWTFPAKSNPERMGDSPRMFRHGKDLYLVGRRDVGGPFDLGLTFLPFDVQKWTNLAAYSVRPKRSALYSIDQVNHQVVPLVDLPGCGDTAFPSVWRTGPHEWLLVNYTSPLSDPNRSWIDGQIAADGTQIYMLTISFKKR